MNTIQPCLSYPLHRVVGMEIMVDSDRVRGAENGALTEPVELAALGDAELEERLVLLGRERCWVEARLAGTAAEMHRRIGGRGTAAVMRERLNVSARQATADVELAASPVEFPGTREAWRAGEITVGHARVIARVGADPEHADEPALLDMARGYPVDMFARMTRQYMSTPGLQRRAQPPAQQPVGVAGAGPRRVMAAVGVLRLQHGQAHQHGLRADGAHLPQRRADPHERVTAQQRRADALANLITGEGPFARPKTTLLVIADYDTVTRELRDLRYDDGLPVPADQIARIAAEAKICLLCSALRAIRCGWEEPNATPALASAWCWRPVTAAASTAAPQSRDASPITSCGTPKAGPPTSTTSPCCANAAITSSTTTTGNSTATRTAGTHSDPQSACPANATRPAPRPSATPFCEPDDDTPRCGVRDGRCAQRVKISWNSMIPSSSTETTTGAVGARTP